MDKCFVSIIIPTFNRGHYLPITVDSFLNQGYPKDKFEIILSNNNSTDSTQSIIESYCKEHKNVKSCFVKEQGVHYARNRASKLAKGAILYFTDDDMIADKDLIENIVKVFETDKKVGAASGKILPKWEEEPPEWIVKLCSNHLLSLNDLGDETIIKKKDFCVFSCHQAISREVFFQSGGFNPENTDGEWLGDGETGLNIKIEKLGYKFAYVGSSVIHHIIPQSRMTQGYLNKRLANQGNCDSYTLFKKHKYSKFRLAKNIASHSIKMLDYFFRFKIGKLFCKSNENWRIKIAYISYYLNRIKYDLKLIHDKNRRDLVLKDNWLDDEIRQDF